MVFVKFGVFSSLGIYLVTSAEACRCLLLQYRLWPAGGAAEVHLKRKNAL